MRRSFIPTRPGPALCGRPFATSVKALIRCVAETNRNFFVSSASSATAASPSSSSSCFAKCSLSSRGLGATGLSSGSFSPTTVCRGKPHASHAPGPPPHTACPSGTLAAEFAALKARAAEEDKKRDEQASQIAAALEADNARMALEVIDGLSPERRRYLLVAASAHEWYGGEKVDKELRRADPDADADVSEAEYSSWVKSVFARKGGIDRKTAIRVACYTAVPFVAFGFLDNSVMLVSGDLIDGTVGKFFGLSVMAAAALGGVVSGTMGIQMHGLAERAVHRASWLKAPELLAVQRKHSSYLRATHLGGTLGICLGLVLGMSPLLFLDTEDR